MQIKFNTNLPFIFLFSLYFIFALANQCISQNAFSQFYTSPLRINPSKTGQFNKDIRFGINHRVDKNTQNAFTTNSSFFADAKVFRKFLPMNHLIGFGICGITERRDSEGFSSNTLSASSAYHFPLNEEGDAFLSLGFQIAYTTNTLHKPPVVLEDQIIKWLQAGYQNINPFLLANDVNVNYLDVNSGLSYQGKISYNTFWAIGGAVHHLNEPRKYFQGGELTLSKMLIADMSFETQFKNKSKLYFGFQYQSPNITGKNYTTGIDLELFLQKFRSVSLGLWANKYYQSKYSIAPTAAIKFFDFYVVYAYEAFVSTHNQIQSAMNFSLIYTKATSRESVFEKKFINF